MTVLDLEPSERPTIYIIHENDRWMEPLRSALREMGLEFVEWRLGKGGIVDFSAKPPVGVFYSRMSASSHTRGHRFSCEQTHAVLEWLEMHGRRVVNGSQALLFEISKGMSSTSSVERRSKFFPFFFFSISSLADCLVA